MLIYTDRDANVSSISMMIDGRVIDKKAVPAGQGVMWTANGKIRADERNYLPLWTMPWQAELYNDGRDHEMVVRVVDSKSQNSVKRIVFRVDGMRAVSEGMGSGLGGLVILADFNMIVSECTSIFQPYLICFFVLV